jgi:hypothetical protein
VGRLPPQPALTGRPTNGLPPNGLALLVWITNVGMKAPPPKPPLTDGDPRPPENLHTTDHLRQNKTITITMIIIIMIMIMIIKIK